MHLLRIPLFKLGSAELSSFTNGGTITLGAGETVNIVFTNEKMGLATRTWGFWKTHLDFATMVFNTYVQTIDLGTWQLEDGTSKSMLIDSIEKYMSVMYAAQTKNSDDTRRYSIDKARIHTAHQALAAIMNSYMPGGAPLPDGSTLASIKSTLETGTIKQIQDLGSALGFYNEGGDLIALDPSLGSTGNADPKGAAALGATLPTFADTPPSPMGKNK